MESPKVVSEFLENFEGDVFQVMPNLLERDEDGVCTMNLKLETMGVKCLTINNIGA